MDDIRFGIAVRTARIQRGWRQRDLALLVGVSDAVISRVERGHVDGVTVGALRRIAAALEISVELLPRSRSANVDRLVHARHAELAESVIRWLGRFDGWIVRPEVSFSRFGERGVIDLLLWHSGRHALLVIELKTAIIDVGELLGTLDRKVRNAGEVARGIGWDPVTIGCVLIVAEGATNRRRVRAHAATFTASMPHRVMHLRRWLSDPVTELRALAFFADRRSGQVIQRFDHRQRVTVSRRRPRTTHRSAAEHETGRSPALDTPDAAGPGTAADRDAI